MVFRTQPNFKSKETNSSYLTRKDVPKVAKKYEVIKENIQRVSHDSYHKHNKTSSTLRIKKHLSAALMSKERNSISLLPETNWYNFFASLCYNCLYIS